MPIENALTKIFSREKTIDSKLLNVLGVQVARTVMARAIYNMRPRLHAECASEQETLRRDGLLVIPGFLPRDQFEQIRVEATSFIEDPAHHTKVRQVGSNRLEIVDMRWRGDQLPRTRQFFDEPRVRALLEGAERRRVHGYGMRTLERLVQGDAPGEKDPETDLHSDIFYPVHKCWLYLTDVTPDSGPLVYVKGSHRANLTQLRYLYQESCGPNVGSRRISRDELEHMHLEETAVTCAMNTLVVANTLGYHRRSTGRPGAVRIALHESVRSRPFALR